MLTYWRLPVLISGGGSIANRYREKAHIYVPRAFSNRCTSIFSKKHARKIILVYNEIINGIILGFQEEAGP